MPFKASQNENAAEVTVGQTEILFSYDACVAFTGPAGNRLVNPAYVGFSSTTSKHLNAAGYKTAEVAKSAEDFAARLSVNLKSGL